MSTVEHKADEAGGFEAVVEANHEGMTHHCADLLFVFNYASLLILQDELLQHYLHGVELSIFERTY